MNAAKKRKPVWGDALVALIILAATAVLSSQAPLAYLPALLLASVMTEGVTGLVSMLPVHRVPEKMTEIS